jgi:hypothetical protein
MEDFCVVVTGESKFVDEIKKSFKDSNIKILFSTWVGSEDKYSDKDIVVFDNLPSYCGNGNINLQKISTLNGLLKAKELGYRRALKIRSDIIPTNSKSFLNLLNNEKINLLCWHQHFVGLNGYFVDYLMSGIIIDLIDIWKNVNINLHNVTEVMLTNSLINHLDNINYLLNDLNNDNDLFWLKYGKKLSDYKPNKNYDKYYHKYDFDNIKKEYLKLS